MKAKELLWLCEEIDGQEALRIGLVCRVFPSEELITEALNLARKLASNPPLAMKLSKTVINASLSQGTYESLRFSALCISLLRHMRIQDYLKGVEAFTKR